MFWRSLRFLSWLLAGGLAGSFVHTGGTHAEGSAFGVAVGALLWFLVDISRANKFIASLRANDLRPDDRTPGLWGDLQDRTLKLLRQREQQLTDAQGRLQDFLSALQVSPHGVILLGTDARIEWCNYTAATHFGLDLERDLAQCVGNLVRDPMFTQYLSSRDYAHDLVMVAPGASPSRPMMLSVHLHPYGEGRMLLLSRDITLLEQAEAMRRDFVANVSHEIRTPLTVLAGFVETLQTLELDQAERAHYLDVMSRQSERMRSLVNDLLTLSKLEGSPVPSLDTWVPFSQVMHQVQQDANVLSRLLCTDHSSAHELVFENQTDVEVAGSALELHSALANLVSNAIRYTPSSGRVSVSAFRQPNDTLCFAVLDTGPGIASEHLGRLTERFYRVDRSRSRETGGTGLGLAIVKHVVQRHGATLAIQSTVGSGSEFRITFPANRVRSRHQRI